MTTTPSAATVEAWTMLLRSRHEVVARVEEALKRAGFPPLEWYDVMFELERASQGWLRQSDVNQRVLLAPYNLSRLADRLVREGLVERRQCPQDGRNNVLLITDKGRELRAAMWPAYAAAIEASVGRPLAGDEASQLARLLAKLLVASRPGPAAE